jgi:hypothetical protein
MDISSSTVTGLLTWPEIQYSLVPEFLSRPKPANHWAPDLRRWELLERLGTAFETASHTVEVRRIPTGAGRYNIPNVGIFLWRLQAYRLSESPAVSVDARRFLFSPLGNDTELFNLPQTEDEITHLAAPRNVPGLSSSYRW